MSVPKPFEMVVNNVTIKVSYRRVGGTSQGYWMVLVDGEPFCVAGRAEQNRWRACKQGRAYLGRICQQAVMDCIQTELVILTERG